MKISRAATSLIKSASLYPFQLIVQLEGADGARGLGYVRGAHAGIAKGMRALAEELGQQLTGKELAGPGEMWANMARLCTSIGPDGISNAAMAALDMAAWDMFACSANLPLYKMLGGYRERIPAYASFGINRETPSDTMARIARTSRRKVSMRSKRASPAAAAHRVKMPSASAPSARPSVPTSTF
jgi:L-alanine-DL-glutamate epimerase-like enolase superfamily enzyme